MSISFRLSDVLQPDETRRVWQTSRRQVCSDTLYLQFGDATEGSCKRQCSKDRLYSRQRETRAVKLLARCSPKAAVAIRTPGFPGHALGKRQKNGGALLSEDASWQCFYLVSFIRSRSLRRSSS